MTRAQPAERTSPSPADEAPAGDEPRLLLVTTDDQLRDEIALISAVIGARLECSSQWPAPGGPRPEAPLKARDSQPVRPVAMLCSPEAAATAPTHEPVLLVGRATGNLWEAAAEHPQLTPVPLPAAEAWLSEYLSSRITEQHRAPVVAVAGVFGGVGCTTIAYLCAAELAVREAVPLLLDACSGPGSGISELVPENLGFRSWVRAGNRRRSGSAADPAAELSGQLDWQLLSQTEGRLSPAHLRTGLPVWEGIAVLTGRTPAPEAQAVLAAADAGRRSFGAVLIDAGHRPETILGLADYLDHLFLITPPCPRGAASARELISQLHRQPGQQPEISVVTNGRAATGWDSAQMQQATGVPVIADVAEQRWLRRSDDLSTAYEMLRSSRGAALIGRLLETSGVTSAH